MLNFLRVLMGYAVAGLGGYLVVSDAHPFVAVPFFSGLALVVAGMIFTDPARGIPMLGYCVSAVKNLIPFGRRDEPHEHKRRSDGAPHHHQRHTPPKRMSVSDFTISEPVAPPLERPATHHHKRRDSDGN